MTLRDLIRSDSISPSCRDRIFSGKRRTCYQSTCGNIFLRQDPTTNEDRYRMNRRKNREERSAEWKDFANKISHQGFYKRTNKTVSSLYVAVFGKLDGCVLFSFANYFCKVDRSIDLTIDLSLYDQHFRELQGLGDNHFAV